MQFTLIDQSLIDRRIERNRCVADRAKTLQSRVAGIAKRLGTETLDGQGIAAEPVYVRPEQMVQPQAVQAAHVDPVQEVSQGVSDDMLEALLADVDLGIIQGIEQ